MNIVIGQEVHAKLMAEREQNVPHSTKPGMERYFESSPLCAWQSEVFSRGYRGAELVKSIYGWSVRSDSGMDNFCLLASSRQGQLDGSYEDAVRYAKEWAEQDSARRYVWNRE